MNSFLNDWGLALMTFIPLVGALVMMAIPKEQEGLLKQVAMLTSLAAALFGVLIAIDFDYDRAGELQYLVDAPWIDVINSRYITAIDGMSLPLILLTLLVVPLSLIYTFGHFPEPHNPKACSSSSSRSCCCRCSS